MKISFPEHHLFQILKRFDRQHLPLDIFLNLYFKAHKQLGSKDRRFISETLYGMTRWLFLLDYLGGGDTSWERRYSLYKGFQPNHYAFVNSIPLHIRYSTPLELFEKLVAQFGEKEAIELASICNSQAPTTIRVNPLKTDRDTLLTRLKEHYEVEPTKVSELGIQFKERVPFRDLADYKEGYFEIQDEGSQLVSNYVEPRPKDQVLDYCAGSGGKTLGFAHKMQMQGQIYLHDIRENALEQAKKRLRRAGIQNAQVLNSSHPILPSLVEKMDWVIADVPCSGTGTFRRNPDLKWKFSKPMQERLVLEQREIFEKALSYLKKGGTIVYATCSLLKEENQDQVAYFLKHYPLTHIQSHLLPPQYGGMDGFFIATFSRNAY